MAAFLERDPAALAVGGARLELLAEELAAAAARLLASVADIAVPSPVAPLVDRAAALVAGMRSDADELAGCARRLRQDSAEAAEGELAVLDRFAGIEHRLSSVTRHPR